MRVVGVYPADISFSSTGVAMSRDLQYIFMAEWNGLRVAPLRSTLQTLVHY